MGCIQLKGTDRKAYYEIFGTFFLIIIIVAAAIGYLAFQNSIFLFRHGINIELNAYGQAVLVKDRLLFCFGSTLIPEKVESQECLDEEPLSLKGLISISKGYRIEVEDLFGCDGTLFWEWMNPEVSTEYANEFTFFVPVYDQDLNRNCLGTMTVLI